MGKPSWLITGVQLDYCLYLLDIISYFCLRPHEAVCGVTTRSTGFPVAVKSYQLRHHLATCFAMQKRLYLLSKSSRIGLETPAPGAKDVWLIDAVAKGIGTIP